MTFNDETFYNPESPDALAYMGIGGAALIEQAKNVPYTGTEDKDSQIRENDI